METNDNWMLKKVLFDEDGIPLAYRDPYENDIPFIEIKIAVAVNEMGIIKSIPYDKNNVQIHAEYLDWKSSLKRSVYQWQFSILTADIPIPCELNIIPRIAKAKEE